jgi:hypothetical protein
VEQISLVIRRRNNTVRWQRKADELIGDKKMEDWDKEEVWDAIWTLSNLRAQYSVFDKKGREKYHACSLAIKALREVIGE